MDQPPEKLEEVSVQPDSDRMAAKPEPSDVPVDVETVVTSDHELQAENSADLETKRHDPNGQFEEGSNEPPTGSVFPGLHTNYWCETGRKSLSCSDQSDVELHLGMPNVDEHFHPSGIHVNYEMIDPSSNSPGKSPTELSICPPIEPDEGLLNVVQDQHELPIGKEDIGICERDQKLDNLGEYSDMSDTGKNISIGPEEDTAENSNLREQLRICGYLCKICNREFPYFGSFKAHLRSHDPFMCEKCGKIFQRKYDHQRHKERCVATGRTNLNCKVCGKLFKTEGNLVSHEERCGLQNTFKCKFCKKGFGKKSSLQQHETNHVCQNTKRRTCKADRFDGVTYEKLEKPYECSDCSKCFALEETYACHRSIHTGEKPFACTKCKKAFCLKVAALYHEQTCPSTGCEKVFSCRTKNQKHVRRHYKCKECSKVFTSKSTLDTHQYLHTEGRPYLCSYCGAGFRQREGLKCHERTHTGTKPFKCRYCDKAFIQGSLRKTHELTHTGVKPHKCQYCPKRFSIKCNMEDHERLHTGERFKCSFCDKEFAKKHNRANHERIHTGEMPFKCQVCGEKFRTSGMLCVHRLKHSVNVGYSGKYRHVCSSCPKRFTSKARLQQHEFIHKGELPEFCVECKKPISSMNELMEHELCGSKLFHCLYCNYASNYSRNRDVHQRTHTGEKPFKCSYCDKAFATSGNLVTHTRTHTGEKPFNCSFCQKAFGCSSSLNQHKKVHLGVKKYKCSFCEKRFLQFGQWQCHERVHTGDRPFKCDLCDAAFKQGGDLSKHRHTHFKDKPHVCQHCNKSFAQKNSLLKHKCTGEK